LANSIGERLRAEREARSLSLEDVSSASAIPVHYLDAIEKGGSKLVADDYYLIPFLRRYAEHLDIDGATVVAGYLAEAARRDDSSRVIPLLRESRVSTRTMAIAGGGILVLLILWWLLR
jgi:cytoskeletal protein RodZ